MLQIFLDKDFSSYALALIMIEKNTMLIKIHWAGNIINHLHYS